MPTPPRPNYSQEEVAEILKRALKQQSLREQGLSHEQLLEMADEVGIDREALESAAATLAESRAEEMVRESASRELVEEQRRLFTQLASSLLSYVVVNAGLYWIDRTFTGGVWFYWVMLGWGIGLVFQFRNALFPARSLARRKHREARIVERDERRRLRQERRQKMHNLLSGGGGGQAVNAGAKEFEVAVQAGVDALLGVAARKIQEHAGKALEGQGRRGPSGPRDRRR